MKDYQHVPPKQKTQQDLTIGYSERQTERVRFPESDIGWGKQCVSYL